MPGGNSPIDMIGDGNNNIIVFQNQSGSNVIGKIDSTGSEIWEMALSSNNYRCITNGFGNGYFMIAKLASGDTVLSFISSGGIIKWTKGFSSPNFILGGLNFNEYSSSLIAYGYDNNGIRIIKFDTTGSSNWSLSVANQNKISSCISLQDGNFLFNVIDTNKVITFELDTSGNIFNSNSYTFSYTLKRSKLLSFNNKYILVTENDSNICYLMFCDTSGQVINSNKFKLNNYNLNEILECKNNFINLITTGNDSIYTINIDTTGSLVSIQNSGYAGSFYNPIGPGYTGGSYTLEKSVSNNQGIVLLIDYNFYENATGFTIYANTVIVDQLDRFGINCNNYNTINQSLNINSFSIIPTPLTLSAIASHISLWKDSISCPQQTPSFSKSCGGTVNVINYNKEEQSVIIYPNPTDNNMTIECLYQASIEISNIQGQLIKTFETTGNKTNINVSAFPSGVYIVEVKTGKGISVKKFIKE
jgi:hypothetical protein